MIVRGSPRTAQLAAVAIPLLWLIGSIVAVLMSSFSDLLRLSIVLTQVFLGEWLLLAVWAVVPAISLVWAVRLALAGRVKHALGWSILPVAAILIYFDGAAAGDNLRFQVEKPAYQRVVADAAAGKCSMEDRKRWQVQIDAIDCTDPITIIFIWGGFGSIWNGVVYDAADEIVKPPPERSAIWKCRDIGKLLSWSGASQALGGHFYLAGGDYSSDPDCE
jgi:hypothetical protein